MRGKHDFTNYTLSKFKFTCTYGFLPLATTISMEAETAINLKDLMVVNFPTPADVESQESQNMGTLYGNHDRYK